LPGEDCDDPASRDFFELEGGCGQMVPLTRDEQDLKQHTSETTAASDKQWVFKIYKSSRETIPV